MILAIHVDDGLIIGDAAENIQMVMEHLGKQFGIKEMDVGCFLGPQIEQGSDGSIFVHQEAYTSVYTKGVK